MEKERRKRTLTLRRLKLPRREVGGLLLFAVAVLMLLSLVTFDRLRDRYALAQVDWTHPSSLWELRVPNQGGIVGAYVASGLYNAFGFLALFLPLYLGSWGASLTLKRSWPLFFKKTTLLLATFFFVACVAALSRGQAERLNETITLGGLFAQNAARFCTGLFGVAGSATIFIAGALVLVTILFPLDWGKLSSHLRLPARPKLFWHTAAIRWGRAWEHLKSRRQAEGEQSLSSPTRPQVVLREAAADPPIGAPPRPARVKKAEGPEELNLFSELQKTLNIVKGPELPPEGDYRFPGVDLLNLPSVIKSAVSRDELEQTAQALKQTLETFNVQIEGEAIEAYPGPVITRFEFKPAPGIKVNQIVSLADDLALAMQAKSIRIIAPIPGKAAVGVEIPNRQPQTVYLREIISSGLFQRPERRLPLALGKTIGGEPFVADLSKMPHLLIAGATGSGKSVCLNGIITSLLFRLHPDLLRFVFIDPKMLELSIYQGIPHLLRPVVTTPRQAEKVLQEAVVEMEDRYRKLAQAAVRNIEDYNAKKKRADRLPYLLIVVDELADLMMSTNSARTVMFVARLAQMARAVGIHLLLATQRPSVDVITGVIKANFSSRIAFQVASKGDSRVILDVNGAEKLLGAGDMLFLQTGQPEPVRIHGAYISGQETEQIVNFLKSQTYQPVAAETPLVQTSSPDLETDDTDEDADQLFHQAAELVIRHGQGSVSLLQRRLGIGYQRAARLIDQLEAAGLVGPYVGSKTREVLVDKSYLERFTSPPAQS